MEKPKIKNKCRTILRAAIFGACLYGGFSLLVGFCNIYGPQGLAMLVGAVISHPTDDLIRFLGYNTRQLPPYLHIMNGSLIGATVNAIIGAAMLSLLTSFWMLFKWIFFTKGKNETRN
jgi:hypothetical protein